LYFFPLPQEHGEFLPIFLFTAMTSKLMLFCNGWKNAILLVEG